MRLRDLVLVLLMLTYIFLDVAIILCDISGQQEQHIEEVVDIVEEVVVEDRWREQLLLDQVIFREQLKTTPIFYSSCINEEDYTCLIYATEPIGRYYITAYNHKETGSKITASGKTVHEGTVTTCAADPRYHKFGEYLEIGGRLYVVEDTGSAVKKRHIDIYFASYKEMARYGSNYQTIYKVTFPFGKPNYD